MDANRIDGFGQRYPAFATAGIVCLTEGTGRKNAFFALLPTVSTVINGRNSNFEFTPILSRPESKMPEHESLIYHRKKPFGEEILARRNTPFSTEEVQQRSSRKIADVLCALPGFI